MKYNVYEKQENMEIRNAQIVYMSEILGYTPSKISNYVDLAISTIRVYIRKFAYLLDKAKQWFEDTLFKGEIKNEPCAYVLEFFDEYDKRMFLKIGKTKHIKVRMEQLLSKYGATSAEIKQIYYAKSENYAEIIESMLREHYQNKENSGYIKLDRFQNAYYNLEDLENDSNLQKVLEICA